MTYNTETIGLTQAQSRSAGYGETYSLSFTMEQIRNDEICIRTKITDVEVAMNRPYSLQSRQPLGNSVSGGDHTV